MFQFYVEWNKLLFRLKKQNNRPYCNIVDGICEQLPQTFLIKAIQAAIIQPFITTIFQHRVWNGWNVQYKALALCVLHFPGMLVFLYTMSALYCRFCNIDTIVFQTDFSDIVDNPSFHLVCILPQNLNLHIRHVSTISWKIRKFHTEYKIVID